MSNEIQAGPANLFCPDFDNKKAKTFVINADDVGMHSSIDDAAFQLYQAGKIQTFSLMIPAPTFKSAAAYAKKNNIAVGLHLTLTNEWQDKLPWSATLRKQQVPSLYNKSGRLWENVQQLSENANIQEIEQELRAQIETALSMGLTVTHLDFHMLFQKANKSYFELVLALAQEYQLVMVSTSEQFPHAKKRQNIKTPDRYLLYYNPNERAANPTLSTTLYQDMFFSALPGLHHVAIHPSIRTPLLKSPLADADFRFDEFNVWSNNELESAIAKNNIILTDYQHIKNDIAKRANCIQDTASYPE